MVKATSPATESTNTQKNLDYFGILKNAFSIVRQHRYLWWLGILAGAAGSGFNGGGGNFSGSSSQTNSNGILDFNQIWTEISKWIQANIVLIAVIASIVLIVFIIFTVLSNMAKAGLVHSVDSISRNEESSFGKAMKFGWHKFWRVFGMSLLIGLVIFGILILLASPAIIFLFSNPLISIVLFLIILPVIFLLQSSLVLFMSMRFVISL